MKIVLLLLTLTTESTVCAQEIRKLRMSRSAHRFIRSFFCASESRL